jgi:hypothetical protein
LGVLDQFIQCFSDYVFAFTLRHGVMKCVDHSYQNFMLGIDVRDIDADGATPLDKWHAFSSSSSAHTILQSNLVGHKEKINFSQIWKLPSIT